MVNVCSIHCRCRKCIFSDHYVHPTTYKYLSFNRTSCVYVSNVIFSTICLVYPVVFYMVTVVFYSCDDAQWNFIQNMCGNTICYLSNDKILATFDWIVNTGLPIAIIILANALLVVRVIRQKYRRQRIISWSKQKHMTLQLLISSLYLITWLPSIIIGLI